ncbi:MULTISPECIES: SRPBCC family protein [Mycobacterium]|uniref:Polyketide cyclase n=1 Tax=Mycobacterium kiyosense TaxID=2871094 RepID=A0A9P3QBL7_9MYCO|nr:MULTISPECIES: SRPBCC family protein [Mycobacterium]BDB42024.1 polyketide cyclase [Mycobacterium kiyosense]BDE14693.1 polyketide cyclase [Mycobacterium sp. 20KCMC460]GLB81378.1 polyketide cyclase [Mycobacterium kiyosense]GLB90915.1 polyketide cyclase [Mycobacterium kiyosense]GLB97209.1 polyketide cyclase [Mycobacterium kiyosense]
MTISEALVATRDVSSSRQEVWDVIANGWTYAQWVVGNSRTRAVDAEWPEPGAEIQHSVGVWPLVINDKTVVESCRPGEEIVLRAQLGIIGAARITLRLHDIPDGCRIEMIEVPVSGPMNVLPDRLAMAAVYPRNVECLWRLEALAKGRQPSEVS